MHRTEFEAFFDEIVSDYHSHQCPVCSTIWKHPNDCHGAEEAHKCPKCGSEQWEKFYGAGEPSAIFHDCGATR